MKKFILIIDCVSIFTRLLKGERIEGVLYLDTTTKIPTFKPWYRKSPKHPKDELVMKTPWGWIKRSPKRMKRFSSVPLESTMEQKLNYMDMENRLHKEAIVDFEIIERC